VVDNDVNLAAIGEHWRGGGRGIHNFVFISLGTGIGAGILIDDKIHRGHRWHAGEISHLNVDFEEWQTDFGAAGYLESYLGATPRTGARRALRRNSGELDETAILRLGAAVANIATIIDPELIILGGRVAATQPELIPPFTVWPPESRPTALRFALPNWAKMRLCTAACVSPSIWRTNRCTNFCSIPRPPPLERCAA
jgi:predicted NBD/HSP70 family sugar kinase